MSLLDLCLRACKAYKLYEKARLLLPSDLLTLFTMEVEYHDIPKFYEQTSVRTIIEREKINNFDLYFRYYYDEYAELALYYLLQVRYVYASNYIIDIYLEIHHFDHWKYLTHTLCWDKSTGHIEVLKRNKFRLDRIPISVING